MFSVSLYVAPQQLLPPPHASQTHAKTMACAQTFEGWVRTSVPVLRDSKATTVRQLGLCT